MTKLKDVLHTVSMIQIPENALLHGVTKELTGREEFMDTDDLLNEKIFRADVFDEILGEQGELDGNPMQLSKKVLDQLEELRDLTGEVEYVHIVEIHLIP